MIEIKTVPVYGNKNCNNYCRDLFPFLPYGKITSFVEACTGGGAVAAILASEMENVNIRCYELNNGMYNLLRVIQTHDKDLIEEIEKRKYSLEEFEQDKERIQEYDLLEDIGEINIERAADELMLVMLSRNGGRTDYRNPVPKRIGKSLDQWKKSRCILKKRAEKVIERCNQIIIDSHFAFPIIKFIHESFLEHENELKQGTDTLDNM